jgi:hypothetical protein
MTTARIMIVVWGRPGPEELPLELEPPTVARLKEVTSIPAIEPLFSSWLRLFCAWTDWVDPGAVKELTWRLTTTDPDVMDWTAMFLTLTPAAEAAEFRKDR